MPEARALSDFFIPVNPTQILHLQKGFQVVFNAAAKHTTRPHSSQHTAQSPRQDIRNSFGIAFTLPWTERL